MIPDTYFSAYSLLNEYIRLTFHRKPLPAEIFVLIGSFIIAEIESGKFLLARVRVELK
jgi:hypothetical protein